MFLASDALCLEISTLEDSTDAYQNLKCPLQTVSMYGQVFPFCST